ncbi:NAD(P)/FAD-dependent oxidoreductase [Streptomyces stramineus]
MYDAIVTGARISGSAVAMLLARRGYRVLLLDRARFPSPTASSTNLIHPPGVLRLRQWGVLAELTGHTVPEVRRYSLQSGPVRLEAPLEAVSDGDLRVDYALSPPRAALDHAMVRCAVEAGAELREGASVQGLLRDDDGTVIGVTGTSKETGSFSEKAAIVIGADGKNSKIAELVGAAKYRADPVLSKSYWTYWEGLPPESLVRTYRSNRTHPFTWPTHDGLTIVGVAWPTAEFPAASTGDEIDKKVIDAFAGSTRNLPESSATPAARTGGSPAPYPISSAFRAARGGPWWATRPRPATPSRPRASPTPCSARSCWPKRSATGSPDAVRWPRPCPPTGTAVTCCWWTTTTTPATTPKSPTTRPKSRR